MKDVVEQNHDTGEDTKTSTSRYVPATKGKQPIHVPHLNWHKEAKKETNDEDVEISI